jgi:hypothetical protein
MSANTAILERNRANAQHSTGPRSDEGKRKVSANARKYGLFVCDHTLEQEDPQEYAELLAGYIAQYCPLGVLEEELVRQITSATHRLRRLDRIESAAMFSESIAHTRHEASVIMMERFTNIADLLAKLGRARYQAERAFQRAYKDLEERRRNRLTTRTPPESIEIERDVRHQPVSQFKPKLYRPPAPVSTDPGDSSASHQPNDD